MNITEWIMATVVLFVSALFFIAVFAEDPWADQHYTTAPPIVDGAPSPHRSGRQKMVCSSCHEIISPTAAGLPASTIPPTYRGATAPHTDGRERIDCGNCHKIISKQAVMAWYQRQAGQVNQATTATLGRVKVMPIAARVAIPLPQMVLLDPEAHERFRMRRFQGTVIRIVEKKSATGRENVSILVDSGVKSATWYNLAPRTFLRKSGCDIGTGMFIKGVSFSDKNAGMRYVKSMGVNGALCDVRDTHMVGYWIAGAHHKKDEH